MHGDRIALALTRIEAASARIRHAAGAASARDAALRRQVSAALADLDQLIAALDR